MVTISQFTKHDKGTDFHAFYCNHHVLQFFSKQRRAVLLSTLIAALLFFQLVDEFVLSNLISVMKVIQKCLHDIKLTARIIYFVIICVYCDCFFEWSSFLVAATRHQSFYLWAATGAGSFPSQSRTKFQNSVRYHRFSNDRIHNIKNKWTKICWWRRQSWHN